ncbi:MAG: YitT family protein [Defluviitaleaceae bacterium]|nr:YitT family protein [Defluviitaleaceae bacterium]
MNNSRFSSLKSQFKKQTLWDYFLISVGTMLLAYAIIAFWAQWGLVTGGLSGLAIIIEDFSDELGVHVPIWFTNFALNVPLLVIGYRVIPVRYFVRTVYASMFLVFALWVAEFLPVPDADMLLASVFGGVVAGLGLGLVFRTMATTGGSTLAAEILKRKFFKHLSLATVLFAVDTTIVVMGMLVFGPINTMYAVIGIFVCSKISDAIMQGMHFSKAAFIISKDSEAISEAILRDMNRGCTALDSHGVFTKTPQTMLLCVVPAKQIIHLKDIVYSLDEKAFVIVADVREVLGEGFKTGKEEK